MLINSRLQQICLVVSDHWCRDAWEDVPSNTADNTTILSEENIDTRQVAITTKLKTTPHSVSFGTLGTKFSAKFSLVIELAVVVIVPSFFNHRISDWWTKDRWCTCCFILIAMVNHGVVNKEGIALKYACWFFYLVLDDLVQCEVSLSWNMPVFTRESLLVVIQIWEDKSPEGSSHPEICLEWLLSWAVKCCFWCSYTVLCLQGVNWYYYDIMVQS